MSPSSGTLLTVSVSAWSSKPLITRISPSSTSTEVETSRVEKVKSGTPILTGPDTAETSCSIRSDTPPSELICGRTVSLTPTSRR